MHNFGEEKTMQRLEANVAVVGGGAAGLAAAVTAAERGASVIVLEKASHAGGSANMGMGLFAVESRLQRLKQISLTREEAFKIHMDYTHWRVDARLVKAFIDKSASTIDWLEKLGVEFNDVECHTPGFNFTWHIVKTPSHGLGKAGGAATMMKLLANRAKELGVQIFLKTPAKKILKSGKQIAGVMAEGKSGEEIQANARAVIIATGGFGDNPNMIKEYTGYEWGHDLFSFRVPGLAGDGIRMAWEVGAAETKMTMMVSGAFPSLLAGPSLRSGHFNTVSTAFQQPNLVVNLLGERFMNEEIMVRTPFASNAVVRQKNRCAFIIFDEDTKNYYVETGLDFTPNLPAPITKAGNFDAELKQSLDRESDNMFFAASSLEELASKTGINLEALRQTIDEYNKACETGRDELFNKNPRYLRPVKQPKFYAGKFLVGGLGSWGGIKINYKTEVLTKDYDVIPGLYAAGTDANAIYGDTYVFVLPASAMGFAINSGRIAGENAVKYALGKD
jgi:fumarate reductase flavoprotein subunit